MGCGASKSAAIADDTGVGGQSSTQIRDIAPTEVADTGARPHSSTIHHGKLPLWSGADTSTTPPGTVPELTAHHASDNHEEGSIIRKHPPKRPQRLEEQPLTILSARNLDARKKVEGKIEEEEEEDLDQIPKTADSLDVASSSEPV